MSPSSTERPERSPRPAVLRGSLVRRVAICAAALVVTVLPTACTYAAYADSPAAAGRGNHAGHGALAPDRPGDDGTSGAAEAGDTEAGDTEAGDTEAGSTEAGSAEEGDTEAADTGQAEDAGRRDGAGAARAEEARADQPDKPDTPAPGNNGGGGEKNNGLDVLGTDCSKSDLQRHDGFQEAPRCVETSFGEVAAADQSPSLLITKAPDIVKAGESFTIAVSTRNLVRDRFLGAAAGGYYLESSFLNDQGIQRGHFHTACRMLDDLDSAPDAEPAPEFFLATQDNGGGAAPDTVTVTVTGMPKPGTVQCAVWAGDGSHRVPMMQRANQTPAFDVVRITVE